MKTKLVKRILAPLSGRLCVSPNGCHNGDQAGYGRRKTSRDLGDADNPNRLRRSRDKELPVTNRIRGGRHGGGVKRRDTAGSEDAWRRCLAHTTDNSYAFRFKFFTFSPQNVFTGWTIISGETTVDETGDANTGSATVKVYDPNGNLLVSLCAETSGTRFEL